MIQEEKMLKMVLSNPELIKEFEYNPKDYESMDEALNADNTIVVAVAKIIHELKGSTEPNVCKMVYTKLFNYLNENYLV